MNKSRKKQRRKLVRDAVHVALARYEPQKCRNIAEVATAVWTIQGRLHINTTEIDRALRRMSKKGEVIQHGEVERKYSLPLENA